MQGILLLRKTSQNVCVILVIALSSLTRSANATLEKQDPVLSCTFDVSLCGFRQDLHDDFNWSHHSGQTPSASTGPVSDHTSTKGKYMFIESSFPRRHGDKARLVSPPIVAFDDTLCLVFHYHMLGEHIGDLSVLVIDQSNKEHVIWQIKGNVGNKWLEARIDLPSSAYQLVFEATIGPSYRGDVAVDDIMVTKGSCDRKLVAHALPKTDIRHTCTSGQFGERGPTQFSDKLNYKMFGDPTKIRIFYDEDGINGMMLGHGGLFHASHGSRSRKGRFSLIKLDVNETISAADIEYDTSVRRLTIHTSSGRQIGPFGGRGLFKKRLEGKKLLFITGTEKKNRMTSVSLHYDSGCKETDRKSLLSFSKRTNRKTKKPLKGTIKNTYVHSIDRLSPERSLNVELVVFVDSEYAKQFHRHGNIVTNDIDELRNHVVQLLSKVQSWYVHPSLGYRLLFTLVKVIYLTPEQEKYSNFVEFCQYQSTFQSQSNKVNVRGTRWDLAVFLTGKEGIFGRRLDGRQIEGRASLGGACNPTNMCAGAYHHFKRPKYMVRLLAHEMAHTFGIRDDYQPPNNKRCRHGLMYNQHRGMSFSKCSVQDLDKWLLSEQSLCLDNIPPNTNVSTRLYDSSSFNKRQGAIDGSWSQWGSWTDCSLTCGGGIRRQRRACNAPSPIRGGRTCTGPRYRNSMCNTTPCIDDQSSNKHSIFDMYAEDCGRKGFKRYAFPEIKGIYSEGTSRCQTMCTSVGESFYRYYPVTDGFSCSSTQNDVCVDGVCLERGCDDGTFESRARNDVCGVCQGDGSTCKVYTGTYNAQFMGKRRIIRIPPKAYNIKININSKQHREMAGNVIHLRTVHGLYMTNKLERSETHVISYAGVTWEYIYDKFGGWTPHVLQTKGPIKKEVDIYLHRTWRAKPNLGIQYSYTVSNKDRRRTRWL